MGLIMNGLLKVPMQFFILLVGVMVFVFYQFNESPLNFNPSAIENVRNSEFSSSLIDLENEKKELDLVIRDQQILYVNTQNNNERKAISENILHLNSIKQDLRDQTKKLITKANPEAETNDKDYVFIYFILNNLPRGLIGLLLAVILSAAMSSTASELNALASTTAIDLYKRNISDKSDKHYVKASKWFTLLWGVIAISIACVANLFDNLIQLVNIIGSIFYGNVLGIFLLAFFIKYVQSTSVFIAALITQFFIIYFWYIDLMPYLWLNLVGCSLVMFIAILIQFSVKNKTNQPSS
jgi:Na+(H+)/acetate symporter ActP